MVVMPECCDVTTDSDLPPACTLLAGRGALLFSMTHALMARATSGSTRVESQISAPADVPRVLMVLTRNQRRGAESSAVVLGAELADRGFDVRMRSLAPTSEGSAHPVRALGRTPLSVATLWRLRREISEADVVVACGSKTLPASVLAAVATGRPVIYQNIGDPLYWAGARLRRLRVRALLRRTTAVAALTEQSSQLLQDHFDVARDRIQVIRNARDSAHFRPPSAEEREQARRRFEIGPTGRLVAMIGSLTPEKRVDLAIRAFKEIDAGTTLAIAGVGPLRSDLESLARVYADGRVRFLGQVEDVHQLLWASDLVLLTSASEGVPGVLIEAGLSGRPVVATDVGFIRDVVVPGVTGYVVAADDISATARAVERGLEQADVLGRQARRHCAERFDLPLVADQWASLIRTVGERAST